MKLVKNVGTERVLDHLQGALGQGSAFDAATSALSLIAFSELRAALTKIDRCRLLLPGNADAVTLPTTF